jgi:hypothetical protein
MTAMKLYDKVHNILEKKWIIEIPREFWTSSSLCLQQQTTDFYVLYTTVLSKIDSVWSEIEKSSLAMYLP